MTFHVAIDACSDVTWGHSFEDTKRNLANLVAAHLDLIAADPEHRYNSSVFVELLFFMECFPERRDELLDALRSGRYYVSPFLNNTLWGWQSIESQWRALWHARQLELEHGLDLFEVGLHIELPSLAWGAAEVLAASGLRGLVVPFYAYEGALKGIECPTDFRWEAPSGTHLRTHLDRFACVRGGYWQGQNLCQDWTSFGEWRTHYKGQRIVLAAGMHGDTLRDTYLKVAELAERVQVANGWDDEVRVVRSTYPLFMHECLEAQPDLPVVRGDFGCSWEGWLVSLAALTADARQVERDFVVAEASLAAASLTSPEITTWVRERRERVTWLLAMLADHAWNGSDEPNRRENHRLRREWVRELREEVKAMRERARAAVEVAPANAGLPPQWTEDALTLTYERGGETAAVSLLAQPQGNLLGMQYSADWLEGTRLQLKLERPAGADSDRALLCVAEPSSDSDLILETGGAMLHPDRDLLTGASKHWVAIQHFAAFRSPLVERQIASADAFLWRRDLGGLQLFGNDINSSEVTLDQAGENELTFRFAFRDVAPPVSNAEGVRWACEAIGFTPIWPVYVDPQRAAVVSVTVADRGPNGSVVLRVWELAGEDAPVQIQGEGWSWIQPVDLLERDLGPAVPVSTPQSLAPHTIAAWRLIP